VSRFGDGEILLTVPRKSIGFQKGSEALANRLKEVLGSNANGHIVCISDVFNGFKLYNRSARRFWRAHLFLYGALWDQYLQQSRSYYNTFVTRPYMDFKDKSVSEKWFQSLKQIWDRRDIVFIEGEKSRLGVGNDLFENAKSIRRILCPAQNAFEKYDSIYNEALKLDATSLVLIALGPTATVLAYDLSKVGYQAIDIGHVDVEYEWWRMGSRRKVKIAQKNVNEVIGGDAVASAGEGYNSQIIARIL
jgi:glycosyltransferase family protein